MCPISKRRSLKIGKLGTLDIKSLKINAQRYDTISTCFESGHTAIHGSPFAAKKKNVCSRTGFAALADRGSAAGRENRNTVVFCRLAVQEGATGNAVPFSRRSRAVYSVRNRN
jgi:hypothetical protein